MFICAPRDSQKALIKILKEEYGYTDTEIEFRSGIMGVPITFMQVYNPNQFEIIGKIDAGEITELNIAKPIINGQSVYKRIAIKRKIIHEN